MHNLSYWEHKHFWKFWDFAIVGGGITGLTSAYFIRQKYPNANIAVFERGFLPTGASTKNAGFACFGSMSEILDDLNGNSEEKVFELVEKRYLGLNALRALLGDDLIGYEPCGGYEVFAEEDMHLFEQCQDELESINQHLSDIIGSQVFSDVSNEIGNFGFAGIERMILNKFEGSIDTGLMMRSLINKVEASGVHIFTGVDISEIDCSGQNAHLKSNIGEIKTDKAVIATNGFAGKLLSSIDVKPARAQVLITEPIEGLKLNGTFHHKQGYNYFRNIDNRVLLGGGRHLNKSGEETTELGETEQIQEYLKSLLHNYILPNQEIKIAHQWSGIMGVGNSKDVILKPLGDSAICAVRLGGMGVALGTPNRKRSGGITLITEAYG